MRNIQVTVDHRPDAGQHSRRLFTLQDPLDQTDAPTASEFAFKVLAEGGFLKGLIHVAFPQAASYSFRFERAGLVGYRLAPMQVQPKAAPIVWPP